MTLPVRSALDVLRDRSSSAGAERHRRTSWSSAPCSSADGREFELAAGHVAATGRVDVTVEGREAGRFADRDVGTTTTREEP